MADFERKTIPLLCKGVNVRLAVDQLPPEKFAILKNVRAHRLGFIEPRAGISRVNSDALDQLLIHSIRRLNDPSPGASPGWARIVGAGTKLYTGQSAFTERDSGYSGNPLSLVPFRPERNPQTWLYVADANRLRKVRADGINHAMGIAPPLGAPGAELADTPLYNIIADFEAVGTWTNGGTAGAPVAAARVTTTITRILYDSGNTGWANLQPAAADEGIQPGMQLTINAGGGTEETVVVEEVHHAITATTIGSISYDAGATGLCTIQPAISPEGIARDSLLLVGPVGPTQEAVRVLSVTLGPDGLYSIRCSCANTHAAAETIVGLPAFRAYCANTHAAPETLGTNYLQTTVAAGLGWLDQVIALDLSRIGTRPTRPEDEIHISILVDAPQNVVEGKVLLDCDAATNDFTQNFFFKALRANDFTPATRDTLTVSTTRQRALQRGIIDSSGYRAEQPPRVGSEHGRWGEHYGEQDPTRQDETQDETETTEEPVSDQAITGASQWTELRFKVKDLDRVGSDGTRGLANVEAIRVSINVTASTILRLDAWWVGGAYGPSVEVNANTGMWGAPFQYRYRYRSSTTGAKSLPGPATRYGLTPHRQRVVLTAAVSADPQVERIDFERWGGSRPGWHYVGTVENSGTPTFNDDYSTGEIVGNLSLETDAFQPFPIVDLPKSGTCDVVGTSVVWTSGDLFNTSWARGTQIVVDGVPYELYAQPSSATRLETMQNVGSKTSVSWTITEPVLLGQPLPTLWGPMPVENFLLACGDTRNPGILYATKGNDPDSAPDTHQIEITSPSEPLMNGCLYDSKALVVSSERWFWVRRSAGPNVLEFQELPVGRGLYARWGLAVGPRIWFIARDGIYETTGGPAVSITEDDLHPLFPHEGSAGEEANGLKAPDMTQTARLRLAYYDGFLYFDYLDTGGHERTLVFDTNLRAWFPDEYTPGQVCHYGEEGDGIHALLSGGNDGRVYLMGGTADHQTEIACQVRPGCLNFGDVRSRKLWGDYALSANPDGVSLTVQPGFDQFSVMPASGTASGGARDLFSFDLAGGLGQLAKDMALDIQWSSDTHSPKLYFWEPAFIAKPEDTYKRATDWIDLGAATWLQGCRLTADTGGTTRTVRLEYDGGTLGATLTVNHNGEIQAPYCWEPFVAHRIRLVVTDAGSWRFFRFEPIGEPMPELATLWKTQPTTHDLSGFQQERLAFIAHMATADITLTVTIDGTAHNYTITHNAGAYKKSRVPFVPSKGRWWQYQLSSTAGFRLFKRDCEVWVKPWSDPGPYRVINPFGEVSRENGARI